MYYPSQSQQIPSNGQGGPSQQSQQQQQQPPAPDDPEQKNIIDKLANFVARNGTEFENITRMKQKENPRFKFLFNGEYYNYYMYRLSLERELMRYQQQGLPSQNQSSSIQLDFSVPPPTANIQQSSSTKDQQILNLQTSIKNFREQIVQSEKNLNAQNEVFKIKKKIQADEIIRGCKMEALNKLLFESKIDINGFDKVLNRIIQSCSKDNIITGRNFIFNINRNLNDKEAEAYCFYLMHRATSKDTTNEAKLHIVYLINDLIYFSFKNNHQSMKKYLEKNIIPSYCIAYEFVDDDNKSKLAKLIEVWEKSSYFNSSIIEVLNLSFFITDFSNKLINFYKKLKNPSTGIKFYEENLHIEYKDKIDLGENEMNNQLKQYEFQHIDFVNHSSNQINILQSQLNQLIQQQASPTPPSQAPTMSIPPPLINLSIPPPSLPQSFNNSNNNNNNQNSFNKPPSLMSINVFDNQSPAKNQSNNNICSLFPNQQQQQTSQPPPHVPLMSIPPPNLVIAKQGPIIPPSNLIIPPPIVLSQPPPQLNQLQNPQSADFSRPPPSLMSFSSLPPPNNITPIPQTTTAPPFLLNDPNKPLKLPEIGMPYYNLPAGLMAPLIKTELCKYKPLNSKSIKLPAPQPPTERLLKAVEEFYAPLNNLTTTKQRNSEGWEKMLLFEFYKSKLRQIMQRKAEKLEQAKRKSKSRRRSKSYSRSRSRSRKRNKQKRKSSYSSSRSRSSRSRSRSKNRNRKHSRSRRSRSRSKSRSRNRSLSRSHSPSSRRSNRPSLSSSTRRRSRSKSITPPSHLTFSAASLDQRLDMSNRGHQLMSKMGWSGQSGLGRKEQGIFNPIEGGEVRDKSDLYKGIGATRNDPFEAFRKNKSQGYIQRLRDRDEQKDLARKLNIEAAKSNYDY